MKYSFAQLHRSVARKHPAGSTAENMKCRVLSGPAVKTNCCEGTPKYLRAGEILHSDRQMRQHALSLEDEAAKSSYQAWPTCKLLNVVAHIIRSTFLFFKPRVLSESLHGQLYIFWHCCIQVCLKTIVNNVIRQLISNPNRLTSLIPFPLQLWITSDVNSKTLHMKPSF